MPDRHSFVSVPARHICFACTIQFASVLRITAHKILRLRATWHDNDTVDRTYDTVDRTYAELRRINFQQLMIAGQVSLIITAQQPYPSNH